MRAAKQEKPSKRVASLTAPVTPIAASGSIERPKSGRRAVRSVSETENNVDLLGKVSRSLEGDLRLFLRPGAAHQRDPVAADHRTATAATNPLDALYPVKPGERMDTSAGTADDTTCRIDRLRLHHASQPEIKRRSVIRSHVVHELCTPYICLVKAIPERS